MLRYEALMLAIPEITQDEAKTIESVVDNAIKNAGGSTLSFERWGKYRLAYPVKKNEYGVYFLIRFEKAADAGPMLEELKTLFAVKLNDIVMRNTISRLPGTGSLEYQRPHSLEEAPPKDVGTFLRENRMEGLMSPAQKPSREMAVEEESFEDEEAQ